MITNIALTQRNPESNIEVFVQGLGKLYNSNLQLDLQKLYPLVKYPVNLDIPMIFLLIR